MTNYSTLAAGFSSKFEVEALLEAKIARAEARLQKLREKAQKTRPHWVGDLAKPFAEWLRAEGGFGKVETYGPFGLGGRFSIHLHPANGIDSHLPREDQITFITVTLDGERRALAMVDYSREVTRYAPNTLGAMNELQDGERDIPTEATAAEVLELARICGRGEG